MKHRFTLKELETWTGNQIMKVLINERMSGLNPNAPLARRLVQVRGAISEPPSVAKVSITEMYQCSHLAEIPKLIDFSEKDYEYINTAQRETSAKDWVSSEPYRDILHDHGYVLYETNDWWYILGVFIDD